MSEIIGTVVYLNLEKEAFHVFLVSVFSYQLCMHYLRFEGSDGCGWCTNSKVNTPH